jgi:hypothetical protein
VLYLLFYALIVFQGKGAKRVGALYVTCQLFKIYFKVFIAPFAFYWGFLLLMLWTYDLICWHEWHLYEILASGVDQIYILMRAKVRVLTFILWTNVLQLGTVHLCRSVIRSIETARIFDFEEFPKRDKVRICICICMHVCMYMHDIFSRLFIFTICFRSHTCTILVVSKFSMKIFHL